MKKIDKKIRKKISSFCQQPEFEWEIYAHKENSDNNWDKFLIHLCCEAQPFMVGTEYNDENYDLPLLKKQEEILFVVCWNWEMDWLRYLFCRR